MKKIIALLLAVLMSLAMAACNHNDPAGSSDQSELDSSVETYPSDDGTLDGILNATREDFESVIQQLTTELDSVYSKMGNSYDSYVTNKKALTDWYAFCQSETEKLFNRTIDKSKEYYKLIVSSVDHEDSDAIDQAMEEYSDAVYDDLFDEYQEVIYEDAFDEINDKYYEGILEDAKDTVDFGDWLDVRSDFYGAWLEARSDFYGAWLGARSDIYGDWLEVKSEFWADNFDVDAILKNANKTESVTPTTTAAKATTTQKKTTQTTAKSSDKISPSFKETMDSYEEFFDTYVAFMKKYANADNPLELMSEYADYMTQYADMMQKLEDVDEDELSTAEVLYYTEVMARITKKLASVG